MKQKPPEIVEVNAQQLQELVSRFESATLDEDDRKLICQVLESYVYVTGLLSDKKTSINRLRKLIFGGKTEKTKNVVGDSANGQNDAGQTGTDEATPEEGGSAASPETMDEDPSDDGAGRQPRPRKPGHGRNSAQAYRAADQVEVPHESLAEGDQCPDCGEGTLYEKPPGVVVRIVGQAPLRATVFRLRKLRCHLCGRVFTAAPPENAGGQKYDATAGSMIAMLKYGSGLPFHRLQRLQWCLETPLPASTQWDVVYAFAPQVLPAYEELIRQAAQGDVMHNDDTTVKILELMGERRRENISQEANSSERTGLFTSGVVATCDGHRVALFFSGRQHSGENLGDVLKHRAEELAAPIQMCDALSRNLPKELQTVVANCIAHGRRHFVDMYDLFPEECRYVLESLKVVYHNDAVACQQAMAPEERLQYHQTHSQPTMNELQAWL